MEARTKSERRRLEIGVVHCRGVVLLAVSSIRRVRAAAVKDLVVEPV